MTRTVAKLVATVMLCSVATGCAAIGRWRGEKYFKEGNTKFERGEYGAASSLFVQATHADPNLVEAWFRQGISNARLGDLGGARYSYTRALRVNPDHEPSAVALADLDLLIYATNPARLEELYEDAQTLTMHVLKRNPNSYEGLRLSGALARAKGDTNLAIANFSKALATRQARPETVLDLVNILFGAGRPVDAISLANVLIDKAPAFGPVYDRLITVYAESKQIPKAEEVLDRKVRNNPGQFEFMIQRADFERAAGNAPVESATLAKLSSAAERNPVIHLLLGDYYSRTGRTDTAIAEYHTGATKLTGPFQWACQAKAATLLLSRGQVAEAKSLATQLRKSSPEDPNVQALYGSVILSDADARTLQKLIHELEAYMGSTKGLDTRNVQAQLSQAYSARAAIETGYQQLQRGDNIGAKHTGEALIRGQMATVEARLILSKARNRLGESVQARELLTDLVRTYPDNPEFHYQLGMLLFGNNDYKSAMREFEAISSADDPRAIAGLARCKLAAGDAGEAVRILEDAVRRHPESPDVRTVLAQVYRANKQYALAAKALEPLVKQGPPPCKLHIEFGENKWLAGDSAVAYETLSKAEPVCSDDRESALALADLQQLVGNNQNAIKTYFRIMNRNSGDEIAMRRVAELELQSGTDLSHATLMAEKLHDKHPDDPDTLDLLGRVYLKSGNPAKALQISTRLVQRVPGKAEYRLQHAIALYKTGSKSESQKELEKLLKDGPASLRPAVQESLSAAANDRSGR